MLTEFDLLTEEQAKDVYRVARGLPTRREGPAYSTIWHKMATETFPHPKTKFDLLKYQQDIRKIIKAHPIKNSTDDGIWVQGGPFPMTAFDNLVAGFPMRGCPIDTRGLR
jgi:hypothetical protein